MASDELLNKVRTALRIKSTAYDDEIQMNINACLYDLKRVNIVIDDDIPDEIATTIIVFVKSRFGNYDASYKESMRTVYLNSRTTLMLDQSKVSGV